MTTLRDIELHLLRNHYVTPRAAARKMAQQFADVEIIEAHTQDRAIIACSECHIELKWMNRKHSGVMPVEATCPEL